MLKGARQAKILQLVREEGQVSNEGLGRLFGVSGATIRRDLRELANRGLLEAEYGGAVDVNWSSGADEPLYQAKMQLNFDAKRRIGMEALAHVRDGDTIMLDSGSTTFQVAVGLKHSRIQNLTVVTSDIKIAGELGDTENSNLTLVVTGGIARTSRYTLYGPFAEATLRNLHAHTAFLGADGAVVERGILNANLDEVPTKQLLIEQSDRVIVLADSSKFGKNFPFRVCGWDKVDTVITESLLFPTEADFFRLNDIRVDIASQPAFTSKGDSDAR